MARVGGDELEEEDELDVFAIHHKHATHERLRQWRKATLALNATRRFRYTLNLERTEEARNFPSKKAVKHYQQAGTGEIDGYLPPQGFGVGPRKLQGIVKARELSFLHQLGEVSGVAKSLRTNIEEGLSGDTNEIHLRKKYFGENNYPRKKQKSFFVFVWETFQDTTLIILMLCAAISLITGMTSKGGVKEGWYDGTSIACAILAVVLVTAISDYKQSLEFQALNDEKKNIHVQVVRMGRTFRTSIFELVVGDIVPLNIGDQVPADGLLIKGHSLSIDESSLTGESEPVLKDSMHPFLLSGCKVIDGHGVMLVTGVGLNTEWGQIMAAISEDIGEETPLQVRLNGTATFIGKVGLIVSVLVFSVLFIRYFTDKYNKHQKASEVASSLSQIFSIALGMDFRSARAQSSVYQMEAFNSIRKRAGVAIILSNGDARVHWKGAAEVILDLCSSWLDVDGRVSEMSNENVWNLKEVISEMATNSLRCIAYAYRDLNKTLLPENEVQRASWKIPDTELTIIAIVGIKDPCRPGVAQAVSECKSAGVKVCMVTGDNLITAISIARECGIYSDGLAIEGSDFRNYSNEEMITNLKKLQVLARSLPSDKLLLVQKLKENSEVVAVTGDGTNDAPALHEAAFQVMVLLTLFYKGIDLLHLDGTKERKDIVRNTTIFNTFVFCQLFNEINARKPEEYNVFAGILKNRMFVSVVVISIIFQGIMVESLNKFAKTTKLSWEQWLISIGIGFLSLPIGLVLKFIKVPRKPLIMTHKIRRKRRSRPDRHAHQQSANEQLDFEQTT